MGNTIQGISPYNLSRDIRPQVATRVLVKSEWGDSFQTVEYLDALSAETTVAPDIGRALLRYRYGEILNAPRTFYDFFDAQELDGKIVKIETVANTNNGERQIFLGIITSESNQTFGDDVGAASGIQTIAAYESTAILDRHTLEGAVFEVTPGVAAVIGNMPDFNRRAKFGLSVLGNRSAARINSAYVFSTDGAVWTNRDVVEYLLAVHSPPGLSFRITGQDAALDTIIETHSLEGMSLFRALNSLVDRHRGLGWNLIGDGDGVFDFNVFTLLDEEISVGDSTVPANDNIVDDLAVSADRGVQATVTYTSDSQFDRVNVIGAKIRSCFTVSFAGGALQQAWTSAEETAYEATVSEEDDAENDAERQTDKHKRVFQSFRIPPDWDGTSDTADPEVRAVALPTVNDDGTIDVTAAAERFMSQKALSRALPIEKSAAISGAEPEYLEPIVVFAKDTIVVTDPIPGLTVDFVSHANGVGAGTLIAVFTSIIAWTPPGGIMGTPVILNNGETKNIFGDDPTKFITVSRISAADLVGAATVTITRRWVQSETVPAGLRMTDGELGFLVEPTINHVLALGSFNSTIRVSGTEPIYDYFSINATVAYDTDERLKVRAKVEGFENIDEPKTLTIAVPDAALWYLTPGTMTGVSGGVIVRDTVGGILRDDSDRLRQIASLALSWYGKRRAILDISWKRITNPGVLGSLVRSVSDSWTRTISGTVITSIEWDFGTEEQTTRIKTSFADLQFEKLITRRDVERMRGEVLEIEKYLGNIPSRFKSGGGGDTTIVETPIFWRENTGESG